MIRKEVDGVLWVRTDNALYVLADSIPEDVWEFCGGDESKVALVMAVSLHATRPGNHCRPDYCVLVYPDFELPEEHDE